MLLSTPLKKCQLIFTYHFPRVTQYFIYLMYFVRHLLNLGEFLLYQYNAYFPQEHVRAPYYSTYMIFPFTYILDIHLITYLHSILTWFNIDRKTNLIVIATSSQRPIMTERNPFSSDRSSENIRK